jgi:hypothetical protein
MPCIPTRSVSFAIASGLIITGCTDEQPGMTEPVGPMATSAGHYSPLIAPPGSIDAIFLEVNKEVSGFAGLIYDEGQPVILLSRPDPEAAVRARGALSDRLPGRALNEAELRWWHVEFEWRDLAAWHVAAVPLLERDDVIFTDAHESLNRIVIGKTRGADKELIRKAAVGEGARGVGAGPERQRVTAARQAVSRRAILVEFPADIDSKSDGAPRVEGCVSSCRHYGRETRRGPAPGLIPSELPAPAAEDAEGRSTTQRAPVPPAARNDPLAPPPRRRPAPPGRPTRCRARRRGARSR